MPTQDDNEHDSRGDDHVVPTFDEYLAACIHNVIEAEHKLVYGPVNDDLGAGNDDGPHNEHDRAREHNDGLADDYDDGAQHHYVQSSDSLNEYYCVDCFEYFPDPDEHERGN